MAAFWHEFSAFFVIFNSARLLRFEGLGETAAVPAGASLLAEPAPDRAHPGMSLSRSLPWALLALSLAANAWLGLRPATEPPEHRSYRPYKSHPYTPPFPEAASPIALSSTSGHAIPLASQLAAFRAYATLAASAQDTAEQHDELARVLARWIATAPADAAEWIAAQAPDDPRLDPALAQLSTQLVAQGRFDAARAWADRIRTPEVRISAIEELLAERYRHRQLTAASLAEAASLAGLPSDRL